MNSYPEKYRERTIEYRQEGHTLKETSETFKVSISAIRKWEKQLKEEGNLKQKPAKRNYKKIDPEKLRLYVQEHPDAYLREIAEEFGCVVSAIRAGLSRIGMTRKKRQSAIGSKTQKR